MNQVEIPFERLEPNTLRVLVEEFITREGTEYGMETPLSDKIEQVLSQLKTGDVVITWNTEMETSNIVLKKDLELPMTDEEKPTQRTSPI